MTSPVRELMGACLLLLLLGANLTGCGQTGDLYLPDEPAPTQMPASEKQPDQTSRVFRQRPVRPV